MTRTTILVTEDDRGLRQALVDTLCVAGYQTRSAVDGLEALDSIKDGDISLVLADLQMPRMNGQALVENIARLRPDLPVIMMTAHGTIDGAVTALRAGARDYITKPFEHRVLVERIEKCLGGTTVEPESVPIAVDPVSKNLMTLATRVASSDLTVMINGESGTGKEVIARHLHRQSSRSKGPFVAVNCAAIPEQMLEATLFGYEKGAYTGAHRSAPGKFEQAQKGTLLLDEISEMDLGLQAKLLRVLQEREVERLGSQHTVSLDVRVLATSNRDLREEVANGRFREDLYYRLNVFCLRLPPLRERPADITPLAEFLARRASQAMGCAFPGFSASAQRKLLSHDWPGNVRELDNTVQRAMVMRGSGQVEAEDLLLESANIPAPGDDGQGGPSDCLGDNLRNREHEVVLETLREVLGNRAAAAERLGISPRTLRYKLAQMRKAGIHIPA